MERGQSQKTLKTFQEKRIYDFGNAEDYDQNAIKDQENDTAEFAKDTINAQNLNTIDLYYPEQISQNLIKQKYKSPDLHQNVENYKIYKGNESSGNVIIESTVEEKLRQTNDLINDALNTLELTQYPQVIDEARIHILRTEKDRLK